MFGVKAKAFFCVSAIIHVSINLDPALSKNVKNLPHPVKNKKTNTMKVMKPKDQPKPVIKGANSPANSK